MFSSNPSMPEFNTQPIQTSNFADFKEPQSFVNQWFGNHGGVHDQMMPLNPNATGNQFHGGETQGHHHQFRIVKSEPQQPLQFQNGTSRWPQENLQQNQFQNNSRGLEVGFPCAENQLSNRMVR